MKKKDTILIVAVLFAAVAALTIWSQRPGGSQIRDPSNSKANQRPEANQTMAIATASGGSPKQTKGDEVKGPGHDKPLWMQELNRAEQLIGAGRNQEALEVILAAYQGRRKDRLAGPESQVALYALTRLAKSYAPAAAAIQELRDAAQREFAADPGHRNRPFELAMFNQAMGQATETIALYDSLGPTDARRHGLALIANDAFVESHRYEDALIGRPFGDMLTRLDRSLELAGTPDSRRNETGLREAVVRRTFTDVEILAGAGRLEEARMLIRRLAPYDRDAASTLEAILSKSPAGTAPTKP